MTIHPLLERGRRVGRAIARHCGTSALALTCLTGPLVALQRSPEAHLGRPVGGDFTLADWSEVSSYFETLARDSKRVTTRSIGRTTEGRDLLLSVITSEANHARLPELRAHARILADPRGKSAELKKAALDDGKVFLFITCAMHATETASPQMAMELAHTLASSDDPFWQQVREEVVVILIPSLNPDGLDHVVSWYRETVGTPYETSGLLKLYQHYVGHDNNRDWFMLSQAETRLLTEQLYSVWRPQVLWDVHEQGSSRERFFVPPFRDPLNPNLDVGIVTGIDLLGTRTMFDMTAAGLTGIASGISYDMWWNGGNRSVPVRHNIVGLLTEAASVDLATPLFQPRNTLSPPRGLAAYAPSNRFPKPWPGGWWRIRNIIDYELAFGRSLLGSLSREGRLWRENCLRASERTIAAGGEAPRAWVIPSDARDPAAVRRLVQTLLLSGIEIHRAGAEFESGGRTWPSRSLVLRRDQPYGAHLRDLFEVQRYPDGDPPYDVAGWTLPILMGVRRATLVDLPETELTRVGDWTQALEGFGGDDRLGFPQAEWRSVRDSDTWPWLFQRLSQGEATTVLTSGERAGLMIPGSEKDVSLLSEDPLTLRQMPRVGVYAPWRGLMNEGWLRFVLDRWQMPYESVRNEAINAGNLSDAFDVLILPDLSASQLDSGRTPGSVPVAFEGGLAPEGAMAIEEFVRGGGTLIAMGGSADWTIDLFGMPLVDASRGAEAGEFSCPGSVLRSVPQSHSMTADLPASQAIFFSRSRAWRLMTSAEEEEQDRTWSHQPDVLLRYAATRLLYSGWIREPQRIADKIAWLRAPVGDGTIHLFAFRPQYRAWSQAAFSLLFRAVVLDPSREED
ncbi:MAG: hypothetical protein ACI841_003171 [Planctomycetota bacterium]|jgi:hypothetical protein